MARARRPKSSRPRPSGVFAPLLTFLVLIILGSRSSYLQATTGTTTQREAIGVEHTSPLTLQWSMAIRNKKSLIELSHQERETIFVSLPADWTLLEVRGTSVSAILSDPPALGLRRWHVPSRAILSFDAQSASAFDVHNASPTSLSIRYVRVDIKTGKKDEGVLLVSKKPAKLF